MSKFLVLLIIIFIVIFFLFKGPSYSDPMEEPMKAGSIQDYNRSMLDISRKIKNPYLKEDFLNALEEIAYGPNEALLYEMGSGLIPIDKDLMQKLSRKCDGKTPNEIIEMAKEERAVKNSIRISSYNKDKMDEISKIYEVIKIDDNIFLFPETKTIHQPPDPQIRRSDSKKATISHRLSYLKTDIRNWRNINNYSPDAIPTTADMTDFLGNDNMNPSYNMHFIILSNGEPACIYNGKTYTLDSRELRDPDYIME